MSQSLLSIKIDLVATLPTAFGNFLIYHEVYLKIEIVLIKLLNSSKSDFYMVLKCGVAQ